MDGTSVMWISIWVLVVCNSLVLFHNLRKLYHRSTLQRQLQGESAHAAPRLREDAFSTLVRYAQLHLDK